MTTIQPAPSIRNFRTVVDGLYRGGQPELSHINQLSKLGMGTVISLRSGRKATNWERAAVEAAGMRFISVPMYYLNMPSHSTIDELLALLDEPAHYPIFIHCYHGVDRTGLIVAVWRMTRQNWTFHQAYDEMKRCGFHRFRLPHFKWLLGNYARLVNPPRGETPPPAGTIKLTCRSNDSSTLNRSTLQQS